ncbi:MAG: TspO/MBR family protein [Methanobacterium sp.]
MHVNKIMINFLDIIPKLSASILIFFFINLIRVILTIPNQTWYLALNKPFFTLPDKIIEPIWLIVFLLGGIAFYLVWKRGFNRREVKNAVYIIITALIINLFGVGLFFVLNMPFLGFLIGIILIIILLIALKRFLNISKSAGILLVPYTIWIVYISALELGIFLLN